jgi:hypothetical protein
MQLCKSTYVYNSLHAMKEVWEARCSALPASSMIMHLHSQNCPHLHPTIPNTRLTTPRTPYPPHDTPTSAPIQPLPQPRRTFFNSLPPAITSPTSLLTPLLSIRARFFLHSLPRISRLQPHFPRRSGSAARLHTMRDTLVLKLA